MIFRVSWILIFYFLINLFGCKAPVTNSLLTDASSCSGSNCASNNPTSTTGSLEMLPSETIMASLVERSDLVEISGTCRDLGRRKNRIIVQVFEGENEASFPVIDNSIDHTCRDNISTSSLQPYVDASGTTQRQTCLVVSDGYGVVETGQSQPQYPQCFNGRFSFKVRLGRIIRKSVNLNSQDNSTNPLANYMVRMKLRTNDGGTQESAWAKVLITRLITKPIFTLTGDANAFRCEVLLASPAKFMDIRYKTDFTWLGPTHGKVTSGGVETFSNSVSGTLYDTADLTGIAPLVLPPSGTGITLDRYYHFGKGAPGGVAQNKGLMPGITYKYKMKAYDFNYATDYNSVFGAGIYEDSGFTNEGSCIIPPPSITQRELDSTTNSCTFTLAGVNSSFTNPGSPYRIEWRYSDSSTWTSLNPNGGTLVSGTVSGGTITSTCRAENTCYIKGPTTASPTPTDPNIPRNKTLYFSARQFIDTNNNFQWDAGEFVGEWFPGNVQNIQTCLIK